MNDTGIIDMFDRMIAQLFDSAALRRIEDGSADPDVWATLDASGFLDGLVAESDGGSGLSFADALPLFLTLGQRAVSFPVGETMIARAVLAEAGQDRPAGPIVLGVPSLALPGAQYAEFILTEASGGVELQRLADTKNIYTENGAQHDPLASKGVLGSDEDAARPLATSAAVLFAALIAGASDTILRMSIDYALQRIQFGRAVASQQVLQQNLAIAVEHVVEARIACEMAVHQDHWPCQIGAAFAKVIAARAATVVTRTAHALHGAIGISGEHDLNLYTTRIHAWRLAGGTESYWAGKMGKNIIDDARPTLTLMREEMFS